MARQDVQQHHFVPLGGGGCCGKNEPIEVVGIAKFMNLMNFIDS
jgi:hypothetical protein